MRPQITLFVLICLIVWAPGAFAAGVQNRLINQGCQPQVICDFWTVLIGDRSQPETALDLTVRSRVPSSVARNMVRTTTSCSVC